MWYLADGPIRPIVHTTILILRGYPKQFHCFHLSADFRTKTGFPSHSTGNAPVHPYTIEFLQTLLLLLMEIHHAALFAYRRWRQVIGMRHSLD